MKAYELTAKANADGELEIPKLPLHLRQDASVRIIVLVDEADVTNEADEPDETGFSTQSFQTSWQQAMRWLLAGRPPLGLGLGNRDWSRCHC